MTSRRKHLTVGEAADRISVSCETIRRYVKQKKLRALILPSGQLRIFIDSLERCAPASDKRLTKAT